MAPSGGALRGAGPTTAWVLTDGKSGDEGPCLALVAALGLTADRRRISPRRFFAALGVVDPRERPSRLAGPVAGPCPDVVIASGRRAVPYLRAIKQASGGRTYTVFLKDPRGASSIADLIWVPEHDGLRGPNVVATLTGPHAASPERLDAARQDPDPRLSGLKAPRAAILAGGDSRHHRFTTGDIGRLLLSLQQLAESGVALMITPSRRTPEALRIGLEALARDHGGFFWDGSGSNPYLGMLALADAVVVTTDSANMLGEAAATGRPILTFAPSGGHPRLDCMLQALDVRGITRPFNGKLEGGRYPPLDATPQIADAIAVGLARHRAGLTVA